MDPIPPFADEAAAREVHETFDAAGHLIRRQTFAAGRLITEETWAYNDAGRLVHTEARAVEGALAPPPPPAPEVPFNISVNGGFATNTDVRSTTLTAGFAFTRKPTPEQYEAQPLEIATFGTYNRTTSLGTPTNDDLRAGFGLDYNNLVGRLTAFLFTTVERNPVANLDVDLNAAPIGLKVEIVPPGVFTFDASFAPVWDYRSVATPAGGECDGVTLSEAGHCTFSKIRGSLRVRAALGNDTVKVKDTLEILPSLNPASGDFIAGIREEAIFRNTASLDVKLAGHLGLSESVVYTHDPLLAEQVDCAADPESRLCYGESLQTTLVLTLTYAL